MTTNNKGNLKNTFKNIKEFIFYVTATLNNTSVTLTDLKGNVLLKSSCGAQGFKGSTKSTGHAAEETAKKVISEARKHISENVLVYINCKGIGPGKESAIKIICSNFAVSGIQDKTAVAHGGCRPPKKRRV
jgi:small subunit ribosomal protein S11